jgi:hypothetical protein
MSCGHGEEEQVISIVTGVSLPMYGYGIVGGEGRVTLSQEEADKLAPHSHRISHQ